MSQFKKGISFFILAILITFSSSWIQNLEAVTFTKQGAVQSKVTLQALLSGTWWGPEWGYIELKQRSNYISGSYDQAYGHVSGFLQGNTIHFKWWEGASTYSASSTRGSGYWIVDTSSKPYTMSGHWKYDYATGWDGEWHLEKQ